MSANKANPKVSIILPVYNGANFLQEGLDSIFSQTYQDFELIIVNDGSTDQTKDILDKITDNRVRIFHNDTNKGITYTLNVGHQNAIGKYITWTSHDNRFRLQAIEKMANYLDKNQNINFVLAGYQYFGGSNRSFPAKEHSFFTMIFNFQGNACFMYRKSTVDLIGYYDEELNVVSDWDYWIRLLEVKPYKCGFIKEILYDYRIHSGQTTNTFNKKNFLELECKLLNKLIDRNKIRIDFDRFAKQHQLLIKKNHKGSIKLVFGKYLSERFR